MSVSSTEHLDKLEFILCDRPAGKNIILHAVDTLESLRAKAQDNKTTIDNLNAEVNHYAREWAKLETLHCSRCIHSDSIAGAENGSSWCRKHEQMTFVFGHGCRACELKPWEQR